MKRVLIAGDSFACDWTKKYNGFGWPNMLTTLYKVKNVAQAGVSEYKIHKQLSRENLDKYDYIIVSHTSPFRIPVEKHPLHSKDKLHKNSDLIYNDILHHVDNHPELSVITQFYEKYMYSEYMEFVHSLLMRDIDNMLDNKKTLHLFHVEDNCVYKFKNMLNFNDIWLANKGLINHYNETGNILVLNKIVEQLEKL